MVPYNQLRWPSPVTAKMKKHACEYPGCDKAFTRAEHLRRHSLNHETASHGYTCQRCFTHFSRPDLLSRHMSRHAKKDAEADFGSLFTFSKPYHEHISCNSSNLRGNPCAGIQGFREDWISINNLKLPDMVHAFAGFHIPELSSPFIGPTKSHQYRGVLVGCVERRIHQYIHSTDSRLFIYIEDMTVTHEPLLVIRWQTGTHAHQRIPSILEITNILLILH